MKPAAPVARETVAPVAREPVAPVARESVAPAARLAAEPITPVARVPAASAATHHLPSSHGPSSSSLALSFLRCAWCTPSGVLNLFGGAPLISIVNSYMEALALAALELEELELETLELLTLELEVLALGVLCLALLELEALCNGARFSFCCSRRLCRHLTRSFARFLQTGSFTERREPESRPASPVRAVRTGRRVLPPHPPPVPGTHIMALRPSSVPLRVPLPPPPESSLPDVPDPESDLAHAASPTVARLLASVVSDPSFESIAAFSLVAKLFDFSAVCRLDYATRLVAEYDYDCPPSVRGECALGTDVLEDRQEEFECLAAAVPRFASMLLAPEGDPDAPDIPTPRSYAEAITGPYSSQWQTAMDAEMASWNLRRPVYGLRQEPREWHEKLRASLAALGFALSTSDTSLFLRTDTSLPPFYVLVYVLQHVGFQYSSPLSTPLPTGHSLSAPPSDESIEPSGPYPELVGCLITSGMGLVLGPVVLTGHADASWVDNLATSSCEAEIYAGAMAAQELRWLTYLLTDLGERPRSSPQRGQLRLACMTIRANTADIFTKALPPGDHQHFCTVLGLVPTLPHLLTA
ncbi:unnamed protein product [Closterium sp. NIES-53]